MGQVRKKKKRRKKRYLLKFTILVALFVGAYFFFTSEIFDIQKIQVEQNSYYTAEQVISIAGAKTGVSVFKVHTGKMKNKLLANPYIQSAKVSRRLPNRLIITVEERKEFAAVAIENADLSQITAAPPAAAPDTGAGIGASSPAAVQTTGGAAQASGAPTSASAVTAPNSGDPGPESAVTAPNSGAPASTAGAPAPDQNAAGQAAAGGSPPQNGAVQPSGEAPAPDAVPPAAGAGQPSGSAASPVPLQPPKIGTLYVVLDKDGLVLRKTDKAPAIPVIYGLTVKEADPGKPLKAEENLMFSDTLNMVQSMNQNDLFFKKIQVSPVVVKAYIYDNLICEGPPDVIEKSMKSLKDTLYVLYQQGIQRGVIHASGDSHMPFTFSPVIEQ